MKHSVTLGSFIHLRPAAGIRSTFAEIRLLLLAPKPAQFVQRFQILKLS